MQRTYLTLLLLVIFLSCSKEDLAPSGQTAKARVLYRSCAGTILQWVDAPASEGQDWAWFTNPNAPGNTANPPRLYPNCVRAFDIPTGRQMAGDTLEFTYHELDLPSGNVCDLGGLPTIYISVRDLKVNKL